MCDFSNWSCWIILKKSLRMQILEIYHLWKFLVHLLYIWRSSPSKWIPWNSSFARRASAKSSASRRAAPSPEEVGWWSMAHGMGIIGMILLMAEILHLLRLVVYPIIYKVFYILGGCLGSLPSTVVYQAKQFIGIRGTMWWSRMMMLLQSCILFSFQVYFWVSWAMYDMMLGGNFYDNLTANRRNWCVFVDSGWHGWVSKLDERTATKGLCQVSLDGREIRMIRLPPYFPHPRYEGPIGPYIVLCKENGGHGINIQSHQ